MKQKVILAFSGGLDTSFCTLYLKEKGFDDKFVKIVQSHGCGYNEIPALKDRQRTEKIEHALIAAEMLTGKKNTIIHLLIFWDIPSERGCPETEMDSILQVSVRQ